MPTTARSDLKGIGGWLALLALGQCLSILRLCATFIQNFRGYGPILDIPGAQMAIYTEIAMNFGLIGLAIATAIALFKKKRTFQALFLCQWLAMLACIPLNAIIVASVLNLNMSDLMTSDDFRTTLAAFVGGGIWVWYTRVSYRVKNTMIN